MEGFAEGVAESSKEGFADTFAGGFSEGFVEGFVEGLASRKASLKALLLVSCGFGDMQTDTQNRCHNSLENRENEAWRVQNPWTIIQNQALGVLGGLWGYSFGPRGRPLYAPLR